MTAAKQLGQISVEEYLAGEILSKVKHEYTGGYVYAMAGGLNVHNRIAGNFFGFMFGKLLSKPCEPFNTDTKIRVPMSTHTRFYYPDGMVVCESNPATDTFQDKPVIIAEVMSRSTRRIDEGEKRDAYLSISTLSVYMLIETESPRVIVYRRMGDEFVPQLYESLEAVIPLDAIKTTLALSELYKRVDFAQAAIEEAAAEEEV